MEMKNFDKEFVERTKEIVQNHCKEQFEYNVTLLLNCLLGLVSLPTERTKPGEVSFQKECVEKLKAMNVVVSDTDDKKTFRCVKNALSHMYIDPYNHNGKIEEIVLEDRVRKGVAEHTKLVFSVKQLKEFAIFVADKHLDRMNKKTTTI